MSMVRSFCNAALAKTNKMSLRRPLERKAHWLMPRDEQGRYRECYPGRCCGFPFLPQDDRQGAVSDVEEMVPVDDG